MPSITPISEKQGRRLGKLQEAERLHAELALLLADLRATYEANPFDHARIANAAADAARRAGDCSQALDSMFTLSDGLDVAEADRRFAALARERRMGGRWP